MDQTETLIIRQLKEGKEKTNTNKTNKTKMKLQISKQVSVSPLSFDMFFLFLRAEWESRKN